MPPTPSRSHAGTAALLIRAQRPSCSWPGQESPSASLSGAASASRPLHRHPGPGLGLSATPACNGLVSAKATLTWTATSSTFASGYKIQRHKGGAPDGGLTTVSPRTTTTLTQTGLSTGTNYTWNLYAYYQTWTSSVISASATTPVLCL